MKSLFKQIHVSTALLLMTSIGSIYGDCGNLSCIENENCCPCPQRLWGGFIAADVLYWRAFNSGINICLPNEITEDITISSIDSTLRGGTRSPNFRWNPGFRIAAGYELMCSNLDFVASWTHYHSNMHSSRDNGFFRWNINYDAIDLIAGFNSNLTSCFVLRPFGGLRGVSINQSLHNNSIPTGISDEDQSVLITRDKDRFFGIGPLLGIEGEINIICDFSIYADFAFSWLYGHYNTRLRDINEASDSTSFTEFKNKQEACISSIDAGIGIRWRRFICNNLQVILQLGLEHHCYFNYNQFGNYGDLNFDGVNFSVGLLF